MFSLQPYRHQLGRTGLFARLFVKFSCVFVSFPCGVLGHVWCLIVLIPDLCILTYLVTSLVYVLGLFFSLYVVWPEYIRMSKPMPMYHTIYTKRKYIDLYQDIP